MLQIEFPTLTNFVCKKCVEASDISPKVFAMNLSAETILNDLAVIDFILCETSLWGVLRKLKDTDRQVQVYNYS